MVKMPGDVVLTKTLQDSTEKTVTIYTTLVDENINKELKLIKFPVPKSQWSQTYSTKFIDLKRIKRTFEVRGWLDGTDESTATTLSSAISTSDTTINVSDTSSFSDSGYIRIDNEIIEYTGKTATSFTGCTRGKFGTTATTHASGSSVYQYTDVRGDLLAMVLDGGVLTMHYLGNTYDVNVEKISIKEMPSDGDIKFEVMMSLVEGEDL